MGEGFLKFKKKFTTRAILKSVIFGVAAGLFVVGVVLLALKMSKIDIHFAWYILMGVGTALVVGGGIFLALLPTNKRIAKKLDNEYTLQERVQTSLEYAEKDGTVVEMQREDADARLRALRAHKPGVVKILASCVAIVLAVAIAIAALVIPPEAAASIIPRPPRPEDAPFSLTELQIERLEELILEVRGCYLEEERKEPAATEIEEMLEDLKAIDKEGPMVKRVNSALSVIKANVEGEISYKKIAEPLVVAGQNALAQSVYGGVEVYISETFSQIENTNDFYNERFDLVTVQLDKESALWGLKDELRRKETGLAEALTNLVVQLRLALGRATGISEEDALYMILSDFAEALSALSETVGETIGEDVEKANAFDAAFDNFTFLFTQELADQSYRLAMNLYIGNSIRSVFGMSLLHPLKTNTGGSDDKEAPSDGGFGPGDMKYGSDDIVYDPDQGDYVTYGVLINRYYAIVQEVLRGGELTEAQQTALRLYFEILFGAVTEEEVNNG